VAPEHESSSPYSRQPATDPYPEPTRTLYTPLASLSKIHSDPIFPPTPWSSKWSLSFGLSHQKPIYSPHFRRKSLWGGVGSGAVRGESVLVGGLKGCYWSKTVWRTRELHNYIQTENIKQLRVACSECTSTVYCGCCDNVLQWITLNSSEHMKYFCLLFVQWLWNKCFQDGL
jgi:hypothetical protein